MHGWGKIFLPIKITFSHCCPEIMNGKSYVVKDKSPATFMYIMSFNKDISHDKKNHS